MYKIAILGLSLMAVSAFAQEEKTYEKFKENMDLSTSFEARGIKRNPDGRITTLDGEEHCYNCFTEKDLKKQPKLKAWVERYTDEWTEKKTAEKIKDMFQGCEMSADRQEITCGESIYSLSGKVSTAQRMNSKADLGTEIRTFSNKQEANKK